MNQTSPGRPTAITAQGFADGTRVEFRSLASRAEDDGWIVGRLDTGEVVRMPELGHRGLELLSEGHTVGSVRTRLLDETGADVDVADLASQLYELGFVASVDGRQVDDAPASAPSLAWLTPSHVAWLLHPATALAVLVLCLAGGVVVVTTPNRVPTYHDLVWSDTGSVVVLVNAATGWSLVLLHELGHLATARAAGVPGRISLGSRLQFLVAQTDVSGIWVRPRRTRFTVYLAGIAVNVAVAATAILLLAAVDPVGLPRRLLAATMVLSLVMVPFQLMVFMRTDLYFLIQDLTGADNLASEATSYLRRLLRRRAHRTAPAGPAGSTDPAGSTSGASPQVVRWYAALVVVGTAASLAVAAVVTVPATLALLHRAVAALAGPAPPAERADALAVLLVTGSVQVLWARAWWRRHRGASNRRRQHRKEVTP